MQRVGVCTQRKFKNLSSVKFYKKRARNRGYVAEGYIPSQSKILGIFYMPENQKNLDKIYRKKYKILNRI